MSTYSRSNRFLRQSYARRAHVERDEQGFTCRHCGLYVSCAPWLAGVQNRNHCPYCLWSRHMDGLVAGDRLAGCRAAMRPIGLTAKRTRNKYAGDRAGELMLIHRCTVCDKVVINRIAADDNTAAMLDLLDNEHATAAACQPELDAIGVSMLTARDAALVHRRLFGEGHAQVWLGQDAM